MVPLGRIDTEIGVYSLVVALLRLRRWIVEEYWPAFVEDMLAAGEESGTVGGHVA